MLSPHCEPKQGHKETFMHSIPIGAGAVCAALAFFAIPALDRSDQHTGPASVRVNSRAAGLQDQATLAQAADGSLAIAWSSRRARGGSPGLHVQRYAPDGSPQGGETELAPGGHGAQSDSAIAFGKDGELWTAWKELSADAERDGTFVRRGTGIARRIGESETQDLVLTTSGATVIAAWCEAESASGLPVLRFARFAADGALLQSAAPLDELGHGRHVAIAKTPADGFVATWGALDAAGKPCGIAARAFDASGRGGALTMLATGSGAVEPTIASHPEGCVVTWMQRDPSGDRYEVVARRCDREGRPVADAFVVAPAGELAASAAHVVAGTRGDFVVAWNLSNGDLTTRRVTTRRYSADGTPRSGARDLGCELARLESNARPCLAFRQGGGLLAVWSGATPGDAEGVGLSGSSAATRLASPDVAAEVAMPHDPPVYERPSTTRPFTPPAPGPAVAGSDFGFHAVTNTGWTPPDPHLAVGPNHVVTITNGAIAFFQKNGTKDFQQPIENTSGFWGSVGATNFVFDPEVVYDSYANRFIAMAAERATGPAASKFLLAVSDDSNPNGTWYKYRLDVTTQGGGTDIDSPNLAFDQNGIYLSADFFTGATRYLVVMLAKAPLLTGAPPTTVNYHQITTTQSHGLPILYGAAPALYLLEPTGTNLLTLHAISNPLGTPTRTTTTIGVPAFANPFAIPQLGTSGTLTTFGPRFWSCVWRNGSLWATHHIGSGTRTLARWYEIKTNGWPTSGTPTLAQSGNVDPGAGIHTSFSSISCDSQNNMVICCARSATTEYVSIARGYRLAGDAAGTLRALDTIKTNVGIYTTAGRWGDYSQVALDPEDGMSLWYTHEYSPNGSWGTWIGQKRVGALALDSDTPVVSQGAGGTVNFTLKNPAKANLPYLLLGSASGTSPGFLLPSPPGNVVMPLNFDGVTSGILQNLGSPAFTGFVGALDATGTATARLTLPPLPGALGLTLHFAFTQDGTLWDFASNPIALRFVP